MEFALLLFIPQIPPLWEVTPCKVAIYTTTNLIPLLLLLLLLRIAIEVNVTVASLDILKAFSHPISLTGADVTSFTGA